MPRLIGTARQYWDRVWYDTHLIEPGQSIAFLRDCNRACELSNYHQTNLKIAGQLMDDKTAIIMSVGLRMFGKTQDEEDRLLDYFNVQAILGAENYTPTDNLWGPYPGSICSTLRFLHAEEPLPPDDPEPEMIYNNSLVPYSPGYILRKPMLIPVRQKFRLEVSAAPELPEPVVVRGMLFGVAKRDIG